MSIALHMQLDEMPTACWDLLCNLVLSGARHRGKMDAPSAAIAHTHITHRTPMLGFRSCLTDWNLFLTGWTLFLFGWLSKPLIHTTEFQTSHLSPHTLHFRLRISHPNSHFQTSISHLKDLRPATWGPTPQTLLLWRRTDIRHCTSDFTSQSSEFRPRHISYTTLLCCCLSQESMRCEAMRCYAMRCDTMRSYAMRCDAAPAAPAAPAAHAAPAAPKTTKRTFFTGTDCNVVRDGI